MQLDSIFHFGNTYAQELEGLYVPWQPTNVPSQVLLRLNRDLATQLGLNTEALDSPRGADIFSGNEVPTGAIPLAPDWLTWLETHAVDYTLA